MKPRILLRSILHQYYFLLTLGSKEQNILSVEECLSKCVDDYECMALTYKVRLYNIYTKASQFNGNSTGKKNFPKVWSTPSLKALKKLKFF